MAGEWDEATHVRAFAFPENGADRILVADADPMARRWIREVVAGRFWLDEVDSGRLALERMTAGVPPLIIVGRQLTDMTGGQMLAYAAQWLGAPLNTFLLADAAGIAPEIDEAHARVFFRLARTMQPTQVKELLEQASAKIPAAIQPPSAVDDSVLARVIGHAKRIGAETTLEGASRCTIAAAIELVQADRARCLFCDEDTGSLWTEGEDGGDVEASAGLAGFAVRTISSITVPDASADGLYRRDIDDPAGTGHEHLVVLPIAGLDGHVHAVLIVIRNAHHPAFSETEVATLEALATSWAPYLQELVMRVDAEVNQSIHGNDDGADMFRQEAVMSLVRRGVRGDVVRVSPTWIHAAYWIVLASVLAAVGFAALAQIHQYAEGPAVIRFTGRDDVVAYETGTIASLEVTRGQAVKENDVLIRMHDTDATGRLNALKSEFDNKLVAYLQNINDRAVREALTQIRSQLDTARANVEARVIRAKHAGIVKEILVRNGQRIESGKVVLSIVENGATEGVSVLAFLPGGERPRLHAHQVLHLTLPNYRGARITTKVRAISGVLGVNEARARYLGERIGDLPMAPSVVVVEAVLTSPEFEADGQKFTLSDGMLGLAELQLQSHSVLETVIPGLR